MKRGTTDLQGAEVPYVIAKPEVARGIYDSWGQCWAALDGTKGERRYMKVSSREEGEEAILDGQGVVLKAGSYAFTDGNGLGGVGVVLVGMDDADSEPVTVNEIPTSVATVFRGSLIPGLDSDESISVALARLKNILAELAALFLALRELPEQAKVTIVHDYVGVGNWMKGDSRPPRDPVLEAVIGACVNLCADKAMRLTFLYQPSHRSDWAGRHDLARFNRRADELATEGSSPDPGPPVDL
jgi:ribonuclease HI